jgi:hypothetical protein
MSDEVIRGYGTAAAEHGRCRRFLGAPGMGIDLEVEVLS